MSLGQSPETRAFPTVEELPAIRKALIEDWPLQVIAAAIGVSKSNLDYFLWIAITTRSAP